MNQREFFFDMDQFLEFHLKWQYAEERKIMKKLIGMVIVGLMFCNIGYAEMKLIEEKRRLAGRDINWNIM